MDFLKRSWAEINIDNLRYNWNNIKLAANGRYLMPVIKADAYGHGANLLATFYEANGAECFAVSNINEAIKLRNTGITKNILILNYTPIDYIKLLSDLNLSQTVYCEEYANQLSKAAFENNLTIKVHLKLDTGMSRIGFNVQHNVNDKIEIIKNCLDLPNLNFEGVYTHYSSADSLDEQDTAFCDCQYKKFIDTVNKLNEFGYKFKYIHSCNSAGITLRTNNEGNLVRPGIILYGLPPAKNLDVGFQLKPVMSLKSVVTMIKNINIGDYVSYGRTFKASKSTKIATIPLGYADGYPRQLSNKAKVIINGKFANIIGTICMDQLMIDVTDIEDIHIGTTVTVVGTDGDKCITFDDLANMCNTISYEIMCNISVRLPRVYIENDNITEIDYLGNNILFQNT